MLNAAIYVRVSTNIQAEKGYSLSDQLECCRNRAHELGAQSIKEYIDDGYSGAYLERPALEELRQNLNHKIHDLVICFDTSRLSRNLSHQLIISSEIERAGAKLIFVDVTFEQSPSGRLFYTMRSAMDDYERELTRERTMRGKRAKLKAGKVITDSHVYGYDFNPTTSQYEINPYETDVIKKIYHWYLVDRIGGAEIIAQRLSSEGIPSPMDNTHWSATTIRKILRREMYTGAYYTQTFYHKKVGPKKEVRIPRDKSEWIAMTAPVIISKEQHFAACELMDKKRTYKTWKRTTDIYLLQGILMCGKCGRKMSVITTKKINKYYACVSRYPRSADKLCDARYARSRIVDDMFWATLSNICKNINSLNNYIDKNMDRPKYTEDPTDKLNKQLLKIQNEQQAVMNWFSQSLISQELATEKLSALKVKETGIKIKLEKLSNFIPQIDTSIICSMVQECPATPEARRNVILSTISKVTMLRTDDNYGGNYDLDIKIEFK